MNLFNTSQLKLAYEFVQFTYKNIFVTGKAGTGKTTFLHNLKKVSTKRMIVVAPTGVAAINAGGVTMHSFFQMPFSPYIPKDYIEGSQTQNIDSQQVIDGHWKLSKQKINIIKTLDLLVIDEISMVRADILDQVDAVLRRYKNRNKVFGGVQLLMIGDIQQLAPIVKDDEWAILRNYYESIFFFSSKALKKVGFKGIELNHIFRQQDEKFISVLNKIRENKMDNEAYKLLSERHIPGFRPAKDDGYITLTTHNYQAKEINEKELSELDGKESRFKATVDGNFPEYSYPTEVELVLKPDAQVMFVKNDSNPEKLYYNGKIGKITRINDHSVFVKCPGDEEEIQVGRVEWQNMKYAIDAETKEIKEDVAGIFVQYPLKLAWAITIHKSQGLTFERAIIDANSAFAHGQVYVALSRCKTLEGMILSTPLSSSGIISNTKVSDFSNRLENNQPSEQELMASKKDFELALVLELFDFDLILRKLFSGRKMLNVLNATGTEKVTEVVVKVIDVFKSEITGIAAKFESQCKQLFTELPDIKENKTLQERIAKASNYFNEKLEVIIIENLSKLQIETDNKTAKKSVNKFIDELEALTLSKQNCLDMGKNGFSVVKYLEVRAKSSIAEEKNRTKPKNRKIEVPEEIEYPELYNRLKSWRNKIAEQNDLQYFMVLQLKSMHELTNLLPTVKDQLLLIDGLGKKKVELYGNEILEIIQQYIDENNLKSKFDTPELIKFVEKEKKKSTKGENAEKKDTKLISLELFRAGKSIDEIAQERNIKDRTIESHLAKLIEMGEIKVNELVTDEKIAPIESYFNQADNLLLSPAKEELGDDFSWAEIKYVLSHLKHTGKIA
jgi:hypothetical protein